FVLVGDLLRGLRLLRVVVVCNARERADRRSRGRTGSAILAAAGEGADGGADAAGDERVAVARKCVRRRRAAARLRRAAARQRNRRENARGCASESKVPHGWSPPPRE